MKNEKLAAWLAGWTQIYLLDKWSDWYKTNNHFKYQVGDSIKLKRRNSAGFGIDPVGTIVDVIQKENAFGEFEDFYVIDMDLYDYEYYESFNNAISFMEWMRGKDLPKDCRRKTENQTHYKLNIEHHFKKVYG